MFRYLLNNLFCNTDMNHCMWVKTVKFSCNTAKYRHHEKGVDLISTVIERNPLNVLIATELIKKFLAFHGI